MIQIKDITDCLEKVAPLSWQESYDNSGLIVGNPTMECCGIMVCLDVFESVVQEAIAKGCNLIVSHHPFIFKGIKKLDFESETAKILSLAIKHDIAIYATHTNMDSAATGVSFMLAKTLGLENICRLLPSNESDTAYFGLGAIGYLPKQTKAKDFLLRVKQNLDLPAIRYIGDEEKAVEKIAICGGAGAEFLEDAIKNNCDCYLTGDIKYHIFHNTENRIILADIGHFESEQFIKQRIIEIISENFSNFARLFISQEKNRVKYII